jgi:pantothenate kinase type III
VPAGSIAAIATGGLSAASWARSIEGVDEIDPDLTLRGLAALWVEVGSPAVKAAAAR